jgi:hypothetical protein
MPDDVFAGLDAIFADTFGEDVVYTPKATGIPLGVGGKIAAIWIEQPLIVATENADTDATGIELHVQAWVVTPVEGDTVQRVKTGRTCRVVTPIQPDDKGMISVALEVIQS